MSVGKKVFQNFFCWCELFSCKYKEEGSLGKNEWRFLHAQKRLFLLSWQSCMGYFPRSMVHILDTLDVPLVGRHHSGIDDVNNMVSIVQKLALEKGCVYNITGKLKKPPTVQWNQIVKLARSEPSTQWTQQVCRFFVQVKVTVIVHCCKG